MPKSKLPGLTLKRGIWHIDKVINGKRLCESTGPKDYKGAENYAIRRINEFKGRKQVKKFIFNRAAAYYIQTEQKKSIDRDIRCLDNWVPLIGDMTLEQIHMEALRPFIEERLESVRSSTVMRELAVVRRILNLASRVWRDENNQPWLTSAPLLSFKTLEKMDDRKKSYPLTWDEQTKLFAMLPGYLQEMCLFKVNTGARQEELCDLQWRYEVPVPKFNTSVFIIPKSKNGEERVIILNDVAKSIVDSKRGEHGTHVFTYKGSRLERMNNKAWRKAWKACNLPVGDTYNKGVHNLRHTFGMRLRKVGITNETRKVLLGHKSGDITTHYSNAQIKELIESVNMINESRHSPDIILLRLSE